VRRLLVVEVVTVLATVLIAAAPGHVRDRGVGMVLPTGYSLNLDGTCIYLTRAALFMAQADGADPPIAGCRSRWRG